MRRPSGTFWTALLGVAIAVSLADGAHADDFELAKKRANPLAYLTTLTFQFNDDCCYGRFEKQRFHLSTQFVKPISLNDEWYVLSRTVLPFMSTPEIGPRSGEHTGLADTVQSFFLSPKYVEGMAWGVGPAFLLPTATDSYFGSEKWGAGPTITLVQQNDRWTYALLAHHLWSFAGDDVRMRVSTSYAQAGISYTLPSTVAFGLGAEMTYDWVNHVWSIPILLGMSKLFHLGSQPVSFGGTIKYYAATPDFGPTWGGRLTLTFLFPK